MSEMNKNMRLDNWIFAGGSMIGEVYHNPNFPDGTQVRTSSVVEHGDGFVKTRNNIYYLGAMYANKDR